MPRCFNRSKEAFWPSGPTTSSTSKSDCCGIWWGSGGKSSAHLQSEVLILAHNLTPSETANLNPKYVRGFVTEIGGPGSHTAIVAEALGIPAVVGTGPFLTDVSGGETAIIDGYQGLVILQPDEETLARYRHEVVQHQSLAAKLEKLRDLPAETSCGVRIQLLGNIEFPYEVEQCQKRGADGIGLYRTEFLFMSEERRAERNGYSRQAYTDGGRGDEGSSGRDADDRPGRRQAAERAVSAG